mgnify:CR=1 FL=1
MSEQGSIEVKNKARSVVGKVVSNKMDKTIVVLVQRRVKHPLYGKFMSKSTKLKVHDQDNSAAEGDLVSIEESRPISKSKTWVLSKILESAPA